MELSYIVAVFEGPTNALLLTVQAVHRWAPGKGKQTQNKAKEKSEMSIFL